MHNSSHNVHDIHDVISAFLLSGSPSVSEALVYKYCKIAPDSKTKTSLSSVRQGICLNGWGFVARFPIVSERPTSLAPQLTKGDRDPCDPYRIKPAARLVVELVATDFLAGAKADELPAADARRRNERADFMMVNGSNGTKASLKYSVVAARYQQIDFSCI